MKSRELLLWLAVLVLIALLVRSCDNGPAVDPVIKTEYVQGKTDTVIIRDTITLVIWRHHPQAVKVESADSSDFDGGVTVGLRNPRDSIRTYQDSAITSRAGAFVTSTVKGEMLDQKIRLSSYASDSTFIRVDTIRQTLLHQRAVSLSLGASVDLQNGPGVGAMVGIRKWNISYQYYPMNKSNQVGVAYMIFSR